MSDWPPKVEIERCENGYIVKYCDQDSRTRVLPSLVIARVFPSFDIALAHVAEVLDYATQGKGEEE